MNKIDFSGIDAFLFDLGGVVVDISPNAAIEAFRSLGLDNLHNQITHGHHQGLFKEFELGAISSDAFVEAIQDELPQPVEPQTIVDAWNQMLVKLPVERSLLLEKLKRSYPVYLLSNTNVIHRNYFVKMADGYENLEELFTKVFYSYKLQLSKPDVKCFQSVIEKTGIVPQRTLFLDDAELNLEAARQLGFQTVLVTPENSILDIFYEL